MDALPELIDTLETRQGELEAQISAPDFYQQEHARTQVILEQLSETQLALEQAYARWAELEP